MDYKFQQALKFTLKWEGGYVNDPDDPGGETKWGISKRANPSVDIKNLTMEQAAEIYRVKYWEPAGCPALGMAEASAVFDTAVNCGVERAKKWLRDSQDVEEFLGKRRMHYYKLIDDNTRFRKFLNGWLNRLNDLRKHVEILSKEGS